MKENRIGCVNSKGVGETHVIISSQDSSEARAMSSEIFIKALAVDYGCIDFSLSKNPNNVALEINKDIKDIKDEDVTRIKSLIADLVETGPETNFII